MSKRVRAMHQRGRSLRPRDPSRRDSQPEAAPAAAAEQAVQQAEAVEVALPSDSAAATAAELGGVASEPLPSTKRLGTPPSGAVEEIVTEASSPSAADEVVSETSSAPVADEVVSEASSSREADADAARAADAAVSEALFSREADAADAARAADEVVSEALSSREADADAARAADAAVSEASPSREADAGAAVSLRSGRVHAASSDAPEEPLDDLSLSNQFFRGDEDSVPPVEAEEPERAPRVVLTPAMVARRARFRRAVAGVVAFVGALSIVGIGGRAIVSARTRVADVRPATLAATPPAMPPAEPARTAPLLAKGEIAARPTPSVAAPAPSPEPAAAAPAAPAAPAAAETARPTEAPAAAPTEAPALDASAIKALKREAEQLYNAGKNKEAIEKATQVIAADPTDALPYLFLGSALQNTGKWKEGREAYSECVRHATKGPVTECYAMGGKK